MLHETAPMFWDSPDTESGSRSTSARRSGPLFFVPPRSLLSCPRIYLGDSEPILPAPGFLALFFETPPPRSPPPALSLRAPSLPSQDRCRRRSSPRSALPSSCFAYVTSSEFLRRKRWLRPCESLIVESS